MFRDLVIRPGAGHAAIPLDPEEKIGGDEDRLESYRDPLGKRVLLLLHHVHQVDVLLHLPRCHRAPERPLGEIGDDPGDAGRLVCSLGMPAGIDLREALGGRSRDVRVRAANLHRVHTDAIERQLGQLRLRVLEPLLELREPLGGGVGRRLELTGRVRTRGGIRAVVFGRQSFEDPGNGHGQGAIPCFQLHAEINRLPPEVLTILREGRRARHVELGRPDLLVIDPERETDGLGVRRAKAAKEHPNHVLPVDRDAVHGVERVGQAQPGDVVPGRHLAHLGDAPTFRAKPHEGGLHVGGAEERRARHPVGRRDVLLHQHRGQRQHVRDVVEAVARIILREVVGWPDVYAEQVPDGVVVLGAVEPACRHPAGVGRSHPIDPFELAFQPLGDRLTPLFLRLLLLEGRHLAAAEDRGDVLPLLAMVDQRLDRCERLDVQAMFGLPLVAMAGVAELGDERLDCRFEVLGHGRRNGGSLLRFRCRGGRRSRPAGQNRARKGDGEDEQG